MIHYPITEDNPTGKPTAKQELCHLSPAKYRWFAGSWGGGKTLWGAVELACYLFEHPGARALIGRLVREDCEETSWRTFVDEVMPPEFLAKCTFLKSKKKLIFPDGVTEVRYTGLDRPDKLGSYPLDIFWADECCEPGIEPSIPFLMRCTRGLGVHRRAGPPKGLFTGTPAGRNYLYQLFLESQAENPNFYYVQATMDDNPYLDQDWVSEMKTTMRGVYYKRYVLAEFAEFEGQQYPTFREAKHVDYDSIPTAPQDWEVFCAIDPAIRTTAAVWGAQCPNTGNVFIFREYKGEGLTVADNAANILELSGDCGVDLYIIDRKASEQRNVETGTVMLDLWIDAGIDAHPNPDRTTNPSVMRLNQLFSPYDENDPTIRIHASCQDTIYQVQSALWETRVSEARGKEVRKMGEFHHLDCLQYIVQSLDLPYERGGEAKPLSIEQKCMAQAKAKMDNLRVQSVW